MKILTNRNGIALVAVLTLLLILTLLLPAMFTMSESATKRSLRGQNEQKASYFARTALEMSVSAFQDVYDTFEEEKKEVDALIAAGEKDLDLSKFPTYKDFTTHLLTFEDKYENRNSFSAQTLYIFSADNYPMPQKSSYETEDAFKQAWADYEKYAVIYSTDSKKPTGYTLAATADCDIVYEEIADYYKILTSGKMELLVTKYETNDDGTYKLNADGDRIVIGKTAEEQYNDIKTTLETTLKNKQPIDNMVQCYKIDRKEVRFTSIATIDDKPYGDFSRSCVMILPTRPADEKWILPANVESHQIFPDSSKATGITSITYNDSFEITNSSSTTTSQSQPVYMYSCVGNMVVSTEGMEFTGGQNLADLSLGLHPETTTLPDDDPTFACLRSNNMSSWSSSATKDNFVLFSATNGIQVDMPVNLLVNPCRAGRIGDGISANKALYKMLVFQAPTVVFNEKVNSMVSLWVDTSLGDAVREALRALGVPIDSYDAPRMTSLMFAAPENTPYSYFNAGRNGKEVKAGKIIFMEDAYLWIIPTAEDGSNYKTQTVYYKGSDIQLFKVANAGDVYYFNSEVPTGNGGTTGFSLSAWFMDTQYSSYYGNDDGLNFFEKFKNNAFGATRKLYEKYLGKVDYVEDDFHRIGNIYDGDGGRVPQFDDFYVVWDS